MLRPYLTTGGRWRLGLDLTGLQLTAARTEADRRAEARVLVELGWLCSALGDQAARAYYEQALAKFQAIGMVDRAQFVKENLATLHTTDDDAAVVTPSAGTRRRHRVWPFGR